MVITCKPMNLELGTWNFESTPKSSFAPKSPKGDFSIALNFSVFPLGIRAKNTEIQNN